MFNITMFGKQKKIMKKHNEFKNSDAILADKFIFYCHSCKQCWEKPKERWNKAIEYYNDFPSYGKQRKRCTVCCKSDKSATKQNG